jgi:gluconate 2-dehydrogenase subunit 3-like protein
VAIRDDERAVTNPTAHDLVETAHPELLPVEPTTGIPLPPKAQPGYYPGFSTLAQQDFWDDATRTVVLARVREIPPIRFFTPQEATLMQAVLARILPQDDRDEEHKIPLLPAIDERLHAGRIDGYRYEGMPPDGEAHRLGLQAIEAIAHHLHGKPFVDLGPREQDEVLKTIHDGQPPAAEEIWRRMAVKHYWAMLVQDAVDTYYAHPYAWDEIGFGGPAYPRGYMRQERGQPEPWEVQEQRYSWAPPPTALSIGDTSNGWSPSHPGEDRPAGGQEGTH